MAINFFILNGILCKILEAADYLKCKNKDSFLHEHRKERVWGSYELRVRSDELRTRHCKLEKDLPGLPPSTVGKCDGRGVPCNVSSPHHHQTVFV